jgi:hypothetical protein
MQPMAAMGDMNPMMDGGDHGMMGGGFQDDDPEQDEASEISTTTMRKKMILEELGEVEEDMEEGDGVVYDTIPTTTICLATAVAMLSM